MTTSSEICLTTVFDQLSKKGPGVVLTEFPELQPHSDLLHSLAEAEAERVMHHRLEQDFIRQVDELMDELTNRLENGA